MKVNFTKSSKERMFEVLDKSIENDREYYTKICNKDNKLLVSNVCEGTKCQIEKVTTKCPINTKEIGYFHTHPGGTKSLSALDITHAFSLNHKIMCLGYKENINIKNINKVDCYVISNNLHNTVKEQHKLHKLIDNAEANKEIKVLRNKLNSNTRKIEPYIIKSIYTPSNLHNEIKLKKQFQKIL